MIEIWTNNHSISDNIASLQIYNAQIILQGMTNNVMFTCSVGDTIRGGIQVELSKTNGIGDTTYNI
jgi:hypothetical protein